MSSCQGYGKTVICTTNNEHSLTMLSNRVKIYTLWVKTSNKIQSMPMTGLGVWKSKECLNNRSSLLAFEEILHVNSPMIEASLDLSMKRSVSTKAYSSLQKPSHTKTFNVLEDSKNLAEFSIWIFFRQTFITSSGDDSKNLWMVPRIARENHFSF